MSSWSLFDGPPSSREADGGAVRSSSSQRSGSSRPLPGAAHPGISTLKLQRLLKRDVGESESRMESSKFTDRVEDLSPGGVAEIPQQRLRRHESALSALSGYGLLCGCSKFAGRSRPPASSEEDLEAKVVPQQQSLGRSLCVALGVLLTLSGVCLALVAIWKPSLVRVPGWSDGSTTSARLGDESLVVAPLPTSKSTTTEEATTSTWTTTTTTLEAALEGGDTLYCFAVIRAETDEYTLMKSIYDLDPAAGIYGCGDWTVFADKVVSLAETKTVLIPGHIEVGVSKDNTAANTELFMKVWELVIDEGRFKNRDWVVKADPDAVLLPDRLGEYMARHGGRRLQPVASEDKHGPKRFVINCNAYPGHPDFPMIYGSVEIVSRAAVAAYGELRAECSDDLPWKDWGEDFWLTRCMDHLGIERVEDFQVVGDKRCLYPGLPDEDGDISICGDASRSAFHPLKEFSKWSECYDMALKSGGRRDQDVLKSTPAPAVRGGLPILG